MTDALHIKEIARQYGVGGDSEILRMMLIAAGAERERCSKIAELKSAMLPNDSDFTRGYAQGRIAAAADIRKQT